MSTTRLKNLDSRAMADLEAPPCPGCGDDPSVDCCCVYQTDFMDSDGQAYSDELMDEYEASRQPMYEEWHDMIFNRWNGDEREPPRTCGHSDCAECPELQEACMASTGDGRRRYGSLAAVEVDHPRGSRFHEVAEVAFRDYDARTVEENPEFCDGIYVTFQTRFSLEARGRS